MDIGKNIRKLRDKNNITQERLAEYLNISPQAVSKWENGTALPDITLVPVIAAFFEVSIDSLFESGVDYENRRESEYRKKYRKLCANGDVNGRRELMRRALAEYPRNYEFMNNLAESILHSINGDKDFDEIIYLCERVAGGCGDSALVCRANYNLVRTYSYMGDYVRARKYADMLPSFKISREEAMEYALKGGERDTQAQSNAFEYMLRAFSMLLERSGMGSGSLSHRENRPTDEQELMIYETIEKLYGIIFPDGNYFAVNGKLAQLHRFKARFWAKRGEKDKAMQELLAAEKCADDFENSKDKGIRYTSVFFDRLAFETDSFVRHWDRGEHGRILRKVNQWDCFNFMRSEEEFKEFYERIRKKAEKE